MITDAFIRVICDSCGTEEEIQLTALARGWDDRNVEQEIEELGWKTIVEGDEHFCVDCLIPDVEV